jgi:hypothetical protein
MYAIPAMVQKRQLPMLLLNIFSGLIELKKTYGGYAVIAKQLYEILFLLAALYFYGNFLILAGFFSVSVLHGIVQFAR